MGEDAEKRESKSIPDEVRAASVEFVGDVDRITERVDLNKDVKEIGRKKATIDEDRAESVEFVEDVDRITENVDAKREKEAPKEVFDRKTSEEHANTLRNALSTRGFGVRRIRDADLPIGEREIAKQWIARREKERGMDRDFPFFIPGPAGSESDGGRSKFNYNAWHACMQANNIRPYGDDQMECCVEMLKRNAYGSDRRKMKLAVRIESVKVIGKLMVVTLGDPSGSMSATLAEGVYSDKKHLIDVGTVMMLVDVFAVLYRHGDARGINTSLEESFNMTVQSENVEAVFNMKDGLGFDKKEIVPDMYLEGVTKQANPSVQLLRNDRKRYLENSGSDDGDKRVRK